MKRSLSLMGGALCAAVLLNAAPASAHIKMLKPTSWLKADATGGATEKGGPCGPGGYDAIYNSSTPSGVVTTFKAGETITVEWAETIDHPGYFRIALAENRDDLKDPTVPFTDMANCNVDHSKVPTGAHDNVLADGILLTDDATKRPTHPNYTYQVTLPNKPCEKCTLQLIQFMEKHPPGCIYYHCADIKIVAATGDAGVASDAGSNDAGSSVGGDAGTQPDAGAVGTGGATTGGGTPGGQGPGSSVAGGGTTGGTTPSIGGAAGGVSGNAGGVAGTAGGAAGGTTGGQGGTTAATGLAAGAGGSASGVAGPADDDDASCSISLGRTRTHAGILVVSLLGLGLLLRRRARARHRRAAE